MGSTNKTTNYNLSQYIGTDKPTYLGDYNGDMLKIDTQMKANSDSISQANSLAGTAQAKAEESLNKSNTNTNSINDINQNIASIKNDIVDTKTGVQEAKQQANLANNTANNGLTTANNALTSVNLINEWKTAQQSVLLSNAQSGMKVNFAWNKTLKLLSIYSVISITPQDTLPATGIICQLPASLINDLGIKSNRNLTSSSSLTAGTGSGSGVGFGKISLLPGTNDLKLTSFTYSPDAGSGHTWILNISFFGCMLEIG